MKQPEPSLKHHLIASSRSAVASPQAPPPTVAPITIHWDRWKELRPRGKRNYCLAIVLAVASVFLVSWKLSDKPGFALLCGVVLGPNLVSLAWHVRTWIALARNGIRSTAVVDSLRTIRSAKSGPTWVEVRYHFEAGTAAGRTTFSGRSKAPFELWPALPQGSTVGIRYHSKDPELSRIEEGKFADWGIRQLFSR